MIPSLQGNIGILIEAAGTLGARLDMEDTSLKMTRPAFGGRLMATIVCPRFRPYIATVRPELYVVLGTSGAIQHKAGMQDSGSLGRSRIGDGRNAESDRL